MILALLILGQLNLQNEGIPKGTIKSLNVKGATCTVVQTSGVCTFASVADAGVGARADSEYITYAPTANLSNERVLTDGTNTTVDLGTANQAKVNVTGNVPSASLATSATALAADPSDCAAGQYATTIAASGNLTCAQVTTAQLSGTISDAQLGNNYSGVGACGANQWASTLNDNAAPTCTQPAFTNLSGSASIAQGGTTETASTEDAVLVGASTTDWVPKVLPSCSNATTSKLLYDNSTNAFSCGTDQTGGGGSANTVEVEADFGATGANSASVVVTGQAWVTGTSKIVCSPTMLATADRAEGAEDAVIEQLTAAIHTRSAGVGFTLYVAPQNGVAYGKFLFHCTGA